MKLKDYLDELNEMVKDNPKILEMDVVYAIDNEGNSFQEVHWGPSLGIFKDNEFISASYAEEYGRKAEEANAICVN